ncbi:MAG: serine hydrolase domain-containing protein [Myxococcaceae bacterium]
MKTEFLCLYSPSPLGGEGLGVRSPSPTNGDMLGAPASAHLNLFLEARMLYDFSEACLKMKRLLVLLLMVTIGCASSNPLQTLLSNFLANNAQKSGASGVLLTVQCPALNNGAPLDLTAGEMRKDGPSFPENAMFQIGSNSKSFTAVVLLQLEAEGLLGKSGLESTVDNFFGSSYPKWSKITIKQLLNMTSGIPDFAEDSTVLGLYNSKPYDQITADVILDSEKIKKLLFAAGTGWRYSNTNYALAGKIVEHVTQNSINVEIKKRILMPLNLQHTYYVVNLPKGSVPFEQWPLLVSGYYNANIATLTKPNFGPAQDIKDYSLSITNAAGSIMSDTQDLNTYARSLFQPKELGGKLLTADQINNKLLAFVANDPSDAISAGQSISVINAKNPNGYGLGIDAHYDSQSGLVWYGHTGGTYGFMSVWSYSPNQQISLVTVINSFSNDAGNELLQFSYNPVTDFMVQHCLPVSTSDN